MTQEEGKLMQLIAFIGACLGALLGTLLGAAVVAGQGLAQDAGRDAAAAYPSRSVRIIVPYGAGGPVDTIARIIAGKLSDATGQQHYIENHAGGSGIIGTGLAAQAAADGYTVLFVANDLAARPALARNLPYDPIKSFEALSLLAVSPHVIVVHPTLNVRTMSDFVSHVRAHPAKYAYASPGHLTTTHLAAERLFRLSQKLDIVHVPFNGGGPAIEAVLGGHTMIAVTALAAAAPYITDGTLVALAVTTAKREPNYPAIPTLAEAGIAGQESDVMIGAVVPAGTPPAIVRSVHRNLVRAAQQPDVRARAASMGFDLVMSSPEAFAAHIKAELAEWTKVAAEMDVGPK